MSRRITAIAGACLLAVLALAPGASATTIETTKLGDENGLDPDNGTCTLREAVIAANTDAAKDACPAGNGPDTIKLKRGTYMLSVAGGDPNNGVTEIDARKGDLDIDGAQRLTLVGHRKGTTIDGNGLDRVMDIFGRATLRRLTITGGSPPYNNGGGLRILGGASGNGKATLIDTTVRDNTAANPVSGYAAGISVFGSDASLTLIGSQVISNEGPGTGGIDAYDTAVSLRDSRVSGNRSLSGGGTGGIFIGGGTEITITDSVVQGNRGDGNGAGGIDNFNSALTIVRSRVIGNRSQRDGGGISVRDGTTTIRDSEISGNSADDSGGGLTTSTSATGPILTISNSTISNNTAYADGTYDASYEDGGGLALVASANNVRILNSTIAGNHAYRGGGVLGGAGFGTPVFKGTLIADNTSVNNTNTPDCFGDIDSQGNNLLGHVFVDPSLCTVTPLGSDKVNVPGKIGPLANNGGPTRTHALLRGSKAINNGPGSGPKTDQRGVKRSRRDIGAYELARCGGVIVNRVGTNGRDNLRGTNGADGFLTFGGADRVSARGGRDGVCTGGGRDRIDGGPGRDFCDGGPGRDRATSCERRRSIP